MQNDENPTNSAEEAYEFGVPCSKCFMWNEVCDDVQYPGLCVPKSTKDNNNTIIEQYNQNTTDKGDMLVNEIPGVKSDQGDTGNRGKIQESELKYSNPANFLALYTIIGLAIIASMLIVISKNNPSSQKQKINFDA